MGQPGIILFRTFLLDGVFFQPVLAGAVKKRVANGLIISPTMV
jgi:hypothetical protein